MKPKPSEPRINYLVRVLKEFMESTCAGSETIFYDEAQCDGMCLAEDIANELSIVEDEE